MDIVGILGSINQIQVNTDKAKVDNNPSGLNFLSAAKEVAENMAGGIVVANNSSMKELSFKKEDFSYDRDLPDKIETVYDFIAEIENMLKKKK